jgi:hypothetical protein
LETGEAEFSREFGSFLSTRFPAEYCLRSTTILFIHEVQL